jgi:hypothetical protein
MCGNDILEKSSSPVLIWQAVFRFADAEFALSSGHFADESMYPSNFLAIKVEHSTSAVEVSMLSNGLE